MDDRTLYWIDGAVCECGYEFEPVDVAAREGIEDATWPAVVTQVVLRWKWVHEQPCGGRISFVNPRRALVTAVATPGKMESPFFTA